MALATLLVWCGQATRAAAATQNLDVDGATGNGYGTVTAGATVGWNTVTWNNADDNSRSNWTNGNVAAFNAGANAYTLNATAATTLSGVTVTNGNVTFTKSGSGTLAMSANSTFNIASGKSLTIATAMGGNFTLTKNGAGTLYANNSSALGTGTVSLSVGTLASSNGTSIANALTAAGNATISNLTLTGALTLTGNRTLTLDTANINGAVYLSSTSGNGRILTATVNSGSSTIGGAIANFNGGAGTAGKLTKAGNGTLVLSNTGSTYTGATTINAGVLSVSSLANGGSNSSIGASSNAPASLVINGGTLQYTGSGSSTNRRFTLGANGATIDASGTGALTFDSTSTLAYGTSGQARSLTLTGTSTANNTFKLALADNGAGLTSLTKNDTGTWVLLGAAKTFTGGTTVNGGTLKLGASDMLANTGALTINGGAFDLAGFSDTVGAVTLAGGSINGTGNTLTGSSYALQGGTVNANLGAGTVTVTTGTTTLNGTAAGTTVNVNSGTLTLGASNRLADAATVSVAGGTLNLGSNSDTVGAVTLSSAGSINGSGTLTGSSYALQGGTVNANLGAGTVTVTTGTTTLNGTAAGTTVDVNSGTLTLGASNRLADAATVSVAGGTLNLGSNSDTVGAVTLSSAGSINGSGTLTGSSYALQGGTVNANLGAGAVTVSTGTTTLNGTAAGTTVNVNSGTLTLGANDRLSNSATVSVAGGTLNMGSFNDTISALSLSSGAIGGTGTLTASSFNFSNNSDVTVSAGLGGTGLTKNGTGALILSGNNSFTSAATVNAGTLVLAHNNALGSSILWTHTIASGATLALQGDITVNQGGFNVTGTGYNSTGALRNITGNNTLGGQITFASTPTTIVSEAGKLTITGQPQINANTVTVDGAGAVEFTSSLNASGGGFTKQGTGTLTFSGSVANSFDNLSVKEGTVVLSKTAGTNAVGGNGTITIGDGSGLAGTAILQLNADNQIPDYSSAFSIDSDGRFDLNNHSESINTVTGTGNIQLGSGTLTVGVNGGTSTFGGTITGSGSVIKAGSQTFTISGANSYTGGTTVSNGTLELGASNVLADSGAVNITGGTLNVGSSNETIGALTFSAGSITGTTGTLTASSLAFTNSSAASVSAILGGSAGLAKSNSGELTLSGANTFSGTTTISGGSIKLANSLALQNSTLNYDNLGGTLSFGSLTNATLGGLSGAQSLALTNGSSQAVSLTVGGNNGTTTYSGGLSGSGSLTKSGTGTLTLSGANTYTGATTINGGTLQLSGASRLSNPDIVVNATTAGTTATFALANSATQTINSLTFGGAGATSTSTNNVTLGSSSTLTLGGNVTYVATNNPLGSTISGSGALSLASGTRTFTVGDSSNASTDLTVSSNITGTGNLLKTGAGTLGLSGSNTYSGGTAINGGTLALGSSGAIGSTGTISFGGGTLQFSASNTTDYSSRFSSAAAQAFAFDTNGQSVTFATGLASTGGTLTKTGTGTLTLSGASSYTGATTINGGTLQLSGANRLSNPDIVVNATTPGATATFALANSATQTINSLTFGGAGATSTSTNNVTLGSSSTLTLGGNVTYDATNNPLGSTISGSGALSLASGTRTFTVADSSNAATELTISSNISGAGGIAKEGAGTLALTGSSNTFTGTIAVNAGTLSASGTTNVGGFAALGDHSWVAGPTPTTVISVADGATLAVSSSLTSGTGNGITTQYQTLQLAGSGANGDGALHVLGGVNTWLGNITLAGNTTINNSGNNTLYLGPYIVSSPTTFALNNHTLTFTGASGAYISSTVGNSGGDTGNVIVDLSSSSSTVAFGGTRNYYTGTTNVNNGILRLAVDPGSNPNTAILGTLTIGDGSGGADTAVVKNTYNDQIADNVAVTINSDGKLDLGTYGKDDVIGNLTLNGGHIVTTGSNNGNLYLGGNVSVNTATTSKIDGHAVSGGLNLNNIGGPARTFTVDSGSTLEVNAVVSGGSFVKAGDGTMKLTRDNTFGYAGTTDIQGGILNIQDSNALGQHGSSLTDKGTIVGSGATLQLEKAAGSVAVGAEALTLNGSGFGSLGALNSKAGTNSWSGLVTLGSNATINTDSGSTFTVTGGVTGTATTGNTQTLTVTGSGNTTIGSAIYDNRDNVAPLHPDLHTGTLALTKNGTGTLTLSGNNSFTGAIAVNNGKVDVIANDVLGAHTNAVSVGSSGEFSLSGGGGNTNTIGSLTGTGLTSIAASTTLKVNNTSTDTYDGRISGSGLFEKTGSGTFTFSSTANTSAFNFAGTVQVDTGTMEFQGGSSGSALTIGNLTLLGGTTVYLNASYINVGTLTISGNTILDFGTGGASVLNAQNIYIASGAMVTVKNWTSEVDFLFARANFRRDNGSGTLAVYNAVGSAPENQVQFEGDPQSPDGTKTTWINDYGAYTDWEIRPIPEPSTYGLIFLTGCLGWVTWRLRSRRRDGSARK